MSPLLGGREGREPRVKRLAWLLLPAGAFGLDAASKAWILARLQPGEAMPVIPGFFNLTLGMNAGAIFGSFGGASGGLRTLLFTLAGLAALGFFGYEFLLARTPRLQRVALGLILGGVLGNGLDRLRHGAVVDFLDFVFGGWHYWTFNLADSFIVCGAILMAWGLLRKRAEA
jgi:signal peptidase II